MFQGKTSSHGVLKKLVPQSALYPGDDHSRGTGAIFFLIAEEPALFGFLPCKGMLRVDKHRMAIRQGCSDCIGDA
jgi:hypothetical protein